MIKKNNITLNLCTKKNWLSSWYVYKKEYSSLLQEDLLLIMYIRSVLLKTKTFSFISMRLYKFNKFLVIDIYLFYFILLIRKYFISFVKEISIFLKKNIFLTINKLSFLDMFTNGFYLAHKIAKLIERRVKFRSKTIKLLLAKVKKYSAGIYIQCMGRINNVNIARSDKLYLGSISLNTIDSLVSYGLIIANTVKGLQSIKVWIYIY